MRILFHSTDRLYATTSDIFQVVECRGCRLIRLNPQPTPAELHKFYPPNYWFSPEATAAAQMEQMYRRIVLGDHLRFVERALRESEQSGAVLDVGCGGGLFLQLLRERGHSGNARPFVGLDFSLDAASAAWRVGKVGVACGSLTQSPFAAGSCAAVTMFHVLEHLHDPASYLEAAHRLLAPDGRLIVQVPNAACWQFLLFGERWNGIDVPRHLIDFRASDLDQLLDTCGFEVLRHKHFSLRDNPAGMATSLLRSSTPCRAACAKSTTPMACALPRIFSTWDWSASASRSPCSKRCAAPGRPSWSRPAKKVSGRIEHGSGQVHRL
ncbi:MAG: class I SAM-dependent methyltransferase [Acidobacteriota bacterium]